MEEWMLRDLRAQSERFLREGYDGHNRHPEHTTAAQLRVRARRRRTKAWLRRMLSA